MRFDTESSEYADFKFAKGRASQRYLAPAPISEFRSFAATSPNPSVNVVGVGIGPATKGGEDTNELAVKIFVERKFAPEEVDQADLLPTEIEGLRVDVVEAGRLERHQINPKKRFRPIQPGTSVGFAFPSGPSVMAGSFGALVRRGDEEFILSNNHVLANENWLPLGSPIFQPGLLDRGMNPGDIVARLSQFVPLCLSGNSVDAAIAAVEKGIKRKSDILKIGAPLGVAAAKIGMRVQKFGRTTSYTAGEIVSIDTDVKVTYGMGVITFEDQIMIKGDGGSFSASGDSGSLILDMDRRAIGLLFAGSPQFTIANHIGEVLTSLNVQLA